MTLLVVLFLSVAILILGAMAPRPLGQVVILFTVLAMLIALMPHLLR